jgi:uncharacterized protein
MGICVGEVCMGLVKSRVAPRMSNDSGMPEYEDLDEALSQVECLVATSEGHGMLCGLFCASSEPRAEVWLAHVLDEPSETPEHQVALGLLGDTYEATRAQLVGGAFEFTPLLPDDEIDLESRLEALGAWCAGFLAGLGMGELKSDQQFPPEIVEALRDFMEITKIQIDAGDEEDDERSYAEVVEYVRMGVMLVFEYLQGQRHSITLH